MFMSALMVFASISAAQSVSINIPTRDGFVNVPMQIQVIFENTDASTDIQFPEVDGLDIQRVPGERASTNTTITGGQFSTTTTRTVFFSMTPRRTGSFTIEAFEIMAGGRKFRTNPITIDAQEPPTGGVFRVEVIGNERAVYLGEPLELTLRIYIEPFTDQATGFTLEPRQMIGLIRGDSRFGVFTKALATEQLSFRSIRGTDDAGRAATFYLYEISTIISPQAAGQIDVGDIQVLMDYPILLSRQRRRDPFEGFFGRTTGPPIEQSQLLAAEATVAPIDVLTPPLEGQSGWYTGAVGDYGFHVSAEPLVVHVGDPITLTMRLTDRSGATPNLDYLQSPALSRVQPLVDDFRVPDDPIGGIINGRAKTFTHTIRARDDQVTEIPPIPFSSFDPASGEYRTAWSQPIPLRVEKTATIAAGDLIGSSSPHASSPEEALTEVSGGILANYSGADLLKSHEVRPGLGVAVIIGIGPIGFLATLLILRRSRGDAGVRRRRCAASRARSRLASAENCVGVDRAQAISTALLSFIADREGMPDASATREDVLASVTDPASRTQLEQLLRSCESLQYGGCGDEVLLEDARDVLARLGGPAP
jgi:hypothetical protein